MNYLLLVCSDGVPTPEKTAAMREHVPSWVEEMDRRGVRRFGHQLGPAGAAACVRTRNGETIVTDGPFAESKEFVAGFDVITCADLDEAIEVAAKHPVSWFHAIEVRPFADYPMGLPVPADAHADADADDPAAEIPAGDSIPPPAAGRQRYLLSFCVNGIAESDAEEEAVRRDAVEWVGEAKGAGIHHFGHALRAPRRQPRSAFATARP